jgi:hypothetical protein
MSLICVRKNGVLYTFPNDTEELYVKLKFILNTEKLDKPTLEIRTQLSQCYVNHKKLGVIYSDYIMKEIELIDRD